MTDYFVVETKSVADLESEVRARMQQGWQVCGSMAVVNNEVEPRTAIDKQAYSLLFFQPLIR